MVAIRKGSAAARGRLRVGDVLIRYAGEAVTDLDHLRALIERNRRRRRVVLEVKRNERVVRLEMRTGSLGITVEEGEK